VEVKAVRDPRSKLLEPSLSYDRLVFERKGTRWINVFEGRDMKAEERVGRRRRRKGTAELRSMMRKKIVAVRLFCSKLFELG